MVLVLGGATGRVLGAGVGGTEEGTVFARLVVEVAEETGLAELLEEVVSFAGPSLVSEDVERGLLGGSKGCLGAFSGMDSASEVDWLPVDSSRFFGSSSELSFLRLPVLPGSSSTWIELGDMVFPMGLVCPFFNMNWLNFPGSSPPCSESSSKTPLLTSSSLGFRIDIFRSKTSDVSLNLSLLFFFRHFQGLKILPKPENLLFLFVGGVVSPASTLSMTMLGSAVGWPTSSASASGLTGLETSPCPMIMLYDVSHDNKLSRITETFS